MCDRLLQSGRVHPPQLPGRIRSGEGPRWTRAQPWPRASSRRVRARPSWKTPAVGGGPPAPAAGAVCARGRAPDRADTPPRRAYRGPAPRGWRRPGPARGGRRGSGPGAGCGATASPCAWRPEALLDPDAHPVGAEVHVVGGFVRGHDPGGFLAGHPGTIRVQDRLRSRKAFPAVTVYWPSRATKRPAGPRGPVVAWKVMLRS